MEKYICCYVFISKKFQIYSVCWKKMKFKNLKEIKRRKEKINLEK